jgi:hypothetical protein
VSTNQVAKLCAQSQAEICFAAIRFAVICYRVIGFASLGFAVIGWRVIGFASLRCAVIVVIGCASLASCH